ncbi:unnamed protein product [Jaminaea pallidilutea]
MPPPKSEAVGDLESRADPQAQSPSPRTPTGTVRPATATIPSNPPTDAAQSEEVRLEGREDPRQWSHLHKWLNVVIVSLMGFISPLGSSIIIPGALALNKTFDLDSRPLSLLPVSLFVFGLGAGPFCLAPASELIGRRPVYALTSIVFVLFNIGTATVQTYPGLCILRFLAGVFGSTGPSLGAGSIGDMFSPIERGRAQSLYGLGPLLGPVVGNIIGGWIIQVGTAEWRWLLWTLTIMSGVIAVIVCFCLRETYAPALLERKRAALAKKQAQKLRDLEKQSSNSASDTEELRRIASRHEESVPTLKSRALSAARPSKEVKTKWKQALSRPFRLLFTNPICAIFSIYLGFCYGIIFLFLVEHPLLYERRDPHFFEEERGHGFSHFSARQGPGSSPGGPGGGGGGGGGSGRGSDLPTYGWDPGLAGLTYAGLGIGFLLAAFCGAMLQDPIYQRLTASRGRLGKHLFKGPNTIREIMADRDEERGKAGQDIATSQDPNAQAHQSTPQTQSSPPPYQRQQPQQQQPQQQQSRKGEPEYRLPLCLLGMIILPIGLIIFGWAGQTKCHWIVPLVGSLCVGAGTILCYQSILVYLVDAFIPYSASATASAIFVRSVLAAIFPLFADRLFKRLGFGWGSTLLAFIALLGLPAPILLFKFGARMRNKYRFQG